MTYILLSSGLIANRTRQHRIQSWRAVGMSRMHQPYACSRYCCLLSCEMVSGGKQRHSNRCIMYIFFLKLLQCLSITWLTFIYYDFHNQVRGQPLLTLARHIAQSNKLMVNHSRNAENNYLINLLN